MPKSYRMNVHKRYLTKLRTSMGRAQYLLDRKSFITEMTEMGVVVEGMRVVGAEIRIRHITDDLLFPSATNHISTSFALSLSNWFFSLSFHGRVGLEMIGFRKGCFFLWPFHGRVVLEITDFGTIVFFP